MVSFLNERLNKTDNNLRMEEIVVPESFDRKSLSVRRQSKHTQKFYYNRFCTNGTAYHNEILVV
jgi:hypothetical protein